MCVNNCVARQHARGVVLHSKWRPLPVPYKYGRLVQYLEVGHRGCQLSYDPLFQVSCSCTFTQHPVSQHFLVDGRNCLSVASLSVVHPIQGVGHPWWFFFLFHITICRQVPEAFLEKLTSIFLMYSLMLHVSSWIAALNLTFLLSIAHKPSSCWTLDGDLEALWGVLT